MDGRDKPGQDGTQQCIASKTAALTRMLGSSQRGNPDFDKKTLRKAA
jgi:hypothetical protein